MADLDEKSNHNPRIHIPGFLTAWILVNTLLVPFAFLLALFTSYILGFIGGYVEPGEETLYDWVSYYLGSFVFGGIAGTGIGAAQWVATRKLKIVRFWIPVTIIGFTLGGIIWDIINVLWPSVPLYLGILPLVWIFPAFLAALFQTIALFHGGLRLYLWPIIGALPILFAGTGYSIGFITAFPAGFLAAIISAIVLWGILKKYQKTTFP